MVREFAQTTMRQHDEHRKAFQAHTQALGGQIQDAPNRKFLSVVERAAPNLKQPADVAYLAMDLEKVATDTYLLNLVSLKDPKAKEIMGSVMGVEAQHLGILRAVTILLTGDALDLLAIPVDATRLPNSAGSLAVLDSLEQTDPDLLAAPETGALR